MARKGMEYMGFINFKKKWHTTVQPTGVEDGVWGLMFPPWVIPTNYHIKGRIMGSTTVSPLAIQEFRLSGRAGSVSQDFEFTPDPNNETLSELMDVFLPHEPGSVADGSADTQVNVGLTSREVVPFTEDEFFDREIMLGLPKNALFNADGAIYYIDYFSSSGKIPRHLRGDLTEGFLMGFGMTTEDYPDGTDESLALIGGAGATDPFKQLLDDINDAIQGSQTLDFQMGLDANMLGEPGNSWIHGLGLGTHVASASPLLCDITVSGRMSVYRPSGSTKLAIAAA